MIRIEVYTWGDLEPKTYIADSWRAENTYLYINMPDRIVIYSIYTFSRFEVVR